MSERVLVIFELIHDRRAPLAVAFDQLESDWAMVMEHGPHSVPNWVYRLLVMFREVRDDVYALLRRQEWAA